jgi:hypothetical protein
MSTFTYNPSDQMPRDLREMLREKITGLVVYAQQIDLELGNKQYDKYGGGHWGRVAHSILVPSKKDVGIQYDPAHPADWRFLLVMAKVAGVLLSALDTYEREKKLRDPNREPKSPNRAFMKAAISLPLRDPYFGCEEPAGDWADTLAGYFKNHGEIWQRPEATKEMIRMFLDSMEALVRQDMELQPPESVGDQIKNQKLNSPLCSQAEAAVKEMLNRAERIGQEQPKRRCSPGEFMKMLPPNYVTGEPSYA